MAIAKQIYHKHHIIPKHIGGTDEPSNLEKLSIKDHAEAHRKLYEEYGRWQDKSAYQFLSGQIGKDEFIRNALGNRKGYKFTDEERKLASDRVIGKNNPFYGKKHSKESKLKMSISTTNMSDETRKRLSKAAKLKVLTEEHKRNIGLGQSGEKHWNYGKKWDDEIKNKMKGPRAKITCPHCGKIGGVSNMKRYHFDNCRSK